MIFAGVDLGTSETKGVLVDHHGAVIARAAAPNRMDVPRPGYAEHDAESEWWGNFCRVISQLLDSTDLPAGAVEAVACSGIGPCVLPVDRSMDPLRPAILYGVDTRAAKQVEDFNRQYGREALLARGGNLLTSQSAGPKVQWVKESEPDVFDRAAMFHTSQSFLVAKLTGEHVMDHLTAAYWAPFYDINTRGWAEDWASPVVQMDRLPRIGWPTDIAGGVTGEAAAQTGLKPGTPVLVGTADAPAEAISAGVLNPGDLMIMYGSSCFMIAVATAPEPDGRLWTAPYVFPDRDIVAAGVSTAGTLTRWLIGLLVDDPLGDGRIADHYGDFADWAAMSPPGANGLDLLPFFSGVTTPMEHASASGVMFGLTLKHSRADVSRAVLEGIAQGVRSNVETMIDMEIPLQQIRAVGGGVKNSVWLQAVSDCIGRQQQVVRQNGAAYGDAILAAIASGALAEGGADSWVEVEEVVVPDEELRGLYDRQRDRHHKLYEQTRDLMDEVAGERSGD